MNSSCDSPAEAGSLTTVGPTLSGCGFQSTVIRVGLNTPPFDPAEQHREDHAKINNGPGQIGGAPMAAVEPATAGEGPLPDPLLSYIGPILLPKMMRILGVAAVFWGGWKITRREICKGTVVIVAGGLMIIAMPFARYLSGLYPPEGPMNDSEHPGGPEPRIDAPAARGVHFRARPVTQMRDGVVAVGRWTLMRSTAPRPTSATCALRNTRLPSLS